MATLIQAHDNKNNNSAPSPLSSLLHLPPRRVFRPLLSSTMVHASSSLAEIHLHPCRKLEGVAYLPSLTRSMLEPHTLSHPSSSTSPFITAIILGKFPHAHSLCDRSSFLVPFALFFSHSFLLAFVFFSRKETHSRALRLWVLYTPRSLHMKTPYLH